MNTIFQRKLFDSYGIPEEIMDKITNYVLEFESVSLLLQTKCAYLTGIEDKGEGFMQRYLNVNEAAKEALFLRYHPDEKKPIVPRPRFDKAPDKAKNGWGPVFQLYLNPLEYDYEYRTYKKTDKDSYLLVTTKKVGYIAVCLNTYTLIALNKMAELCDGAKLNTHIEFNEYNPKTWLLVKTNGLEEYDEIIRLKRMKKSLKVSIKTNNVYKNYSWLVNADGERVKDESRSWRLSFKLDEPVEVL